MELAAVLAVCRCLTQHGIGFWVDGGWGVDALLGIDGAALRTVELGLLAGTPGLAALGVTVAALTAGLRGGTALAGLLVIPLAVPLLIFGAGSLAPGGTSGLAYCAAASLVLLALAPFASGAAIRAARG